MIAEQAGDREQEHEWSLENVINVESILLETTNLVGISAIGKAYCNQSINQFHRLEYFKLFLSLLP